MTGMHPRSWPVCLDPGNCRILRDPKGGPGAGWLETGPDCIFFGDAKKSVLCSQVEE